MIARQNGLQVTPVASCLKKSLKTKFIADRKKYCKIFRLRADYIQGLMESYRLHWISRTYVIHCVMNVVHTAS